MRILTQEMINEDIKKLLIDELPMLLLRADEILDSRFQDLELDSLSMLELIMKVEDKYSIKIPDEVAIKFTNGRDICNYIASVV